jgi:hypothetical protein
MLLPRAALLAAAASLSACAVHTLAGGRLVLTSPEFRGYVERVFREQNRVADELAFALESAPPGGALDAAEDALIAACALVNELATTRRDAVDLGVRERAKAARSAPLCERATAAARAVLAGAKVAPN